MTPCFVVSGLPCAGKSTLASALAAHRRWPLLSKDDYKERIFAQRGVGDREWSRRVSALAWDQLLAEAAELLGAGRSCILEGNFREPQAGRVRALVARLAAQPLEVHCVAAAPVLLQRYRARALDGSRHPGHVDLEALPELERELGTTSVTVLAMPASRWVCDTTAGIEVGPMLAKIDAWSARAPLD